MRRGKTRRWRLTGLILVTLGLLLYLGLSPVQQPRKPAAIYNTVYNDTGRVLKTLSIAVGQRVYDIGPLPPGGSLPFHFAPDGAPEYTVTGSFGPGSRITRVLPIGPPPYPNITLRFDTTTIHLNPVDGRFVRDDGPAVGITLRGDGPADGVSVRGNGQ